MTARGFCTCKRDFPGRLTFHPPAGAAWHYLCDKPVLPPEPGDLQRRVEALMNCGYAGRPRIVPTGTGWPVT